MRYQERAGRKQESGCHFRMEEWGTDLSSNRLSEVALQEMKGKDGRQHRRQAYPGIRRSLKTEGDLEGGTTSSWAATLGAILLPFDDNLIGSALIQMSWILTSSVLKLHNSTPCPCCMFRVLVSGVRIGRRIIAERSTKMPESPLLLDHQNIFPRIMGRMTSRKPFALHLRS